MQYLLLICGEEQSAAAVPEEPEGDAGAWVAQMDLRGLRRFGGVLTPPSTATTVRVRDGQAVLTDGPFAETKEQILGFDLIEVADLDEALEAARTHPMAAFGAVEVRALLQQ